MDPPGNQTRPSCDLWGMDCGSAREALSALLDDEPLRARRSTRTWLAARHAGAGARTHIRCHTASAPLPRRATSVRMPCVRSWAAPLEELITPLTGSRYRSVVRPTSAHKVQIHGRAKPGPAGRLGLCEAIDRGLMFRRAVAAHAVSPATAYRRCLANNRPLQQSASRWRGRPIGPVAQSLSALAERRRAGADLCSALSHGLEPTTDRRHCRPSPISAKLFKSKRVSRP